MKDIYLRHTLISWFITEKYDVKGALKERKK